MRDVDDDFNLFGIKLNNMYISRVIKYPPKGDKNIASPPSNMHLHASAMSTKSITQGPIFSFPKILRFQISPNIFVYYLYLGRW